AVEPPPVRRRALLRCEPGGAALPNQSAVLLARAAAVLDGLDAAAAADRRLRDLCTGAAAGVRPARRPTRRRGVYVRGVQRRLAELRYPQRRRAAAAGA